MPQTTVDLHRLGNATSPRMDNVRVGKDIATYDNNGVQWIKAKSGGVSTFSTPSGKPNEWKLNAGSLYDPLLYVVNDYSNHYDWEPNADMPIEAFKALLAAVNPKFTKIS